MDACRISLERGGEEVKPERERLKEEKKNK